MIDCKRSAKHLRTLLVRWFPHGELRVVSTNRVSPVGSLNLSLIALCIDAFVVRCGSRKLVARQLR
jgi:hypothetical protein